MGSPCLHAVKTETGTSLSLASVELRQMTDPGHTHTQKKKRGEQPLGNNTQDSPLAPPTSTHAHTHIHTHKQVHTWYLLVFVR